MARTIQELINERVPASNKKQAKKEWSMFVNNRSYPAKTLFDNLRQLGELNPKRLNESGEQVLTKKEIRAMSTSSLAKSLRLYNRWRRGEGKFKWSEDPNKNKPCPYSTTTLGFLLDAAATVLARK